VLVGPLGLAASGAGASLPIPGPASLVAGRAHVVGHTESFGVPASVKTTNWAGYVDTGRVFNYVKATWTVPRVTCTADTSSASFWVGLDGYQSRTVQQAGTISYCRGGKASYYTWWELYPRNKIQLVGDSVRPGDHVTASVSVSGNRYTMHVVDSTTKGNTFTRHVTCVTCRNASAEWIAERVGRDRALMPLAKFGRMTFLSSRVGSRGTRGSISRFAHSSLIMVNRGGATLAKASSLQRGGNRFVATWLRFK
jgi:hypothetical protein